MRSWWRSTEGLAATEFALAVPFLLALFLGGFELTRYILIHQRLEKVAYTVTDVVSQQTSVTTNQLNRIFTSAAEIMQPYGFSTQGTIILSSVYQVGTVNPPTVRWQSTGGGTLAATTLVGAVNANATLPQSLDLNDQDNVIVAEVYYRYTPVLSGTFIHAANLYKTAVFKPRLGALTTPPS